MRRTAERNTSQEPETRSSHLPFPFSNEPLEWAILTKWPWKCPGIWMHSSSWVTLSTTAHITCALLVIHFSDFFAGFGLNLIRMDKSHLVTWQISFELFSFSTCLFNLVLVKLLTVRSASCFTRQRIRAVRPKWAVTLRETWGSNDGQTFGSSQKEMGLDGGSIGLPAWIEDAPAPDVLDEGEEKKERIGWKGDGKRKMVIHCLESVVFVLSRERNGREEWMNRREKSIRELVMMGKVTQCVGKRKGQESDEGADS